jgi:hypothetical protein
MRKLPAAAAVTLLVLTSGLASAQTQGYRPERPYRGIFAGGLNDSTHSIAANATLSGGYDDDILADATGRNRPVSSRQGTLAQLSGGLNYAMNLNRASVGAGVNSSVRYYPSLEKEYFTTYGAGVGGGIRVLDKPEVSVSGGANYQPLTFLSAFPSLGEQLTVEVAEPDFVPVESQYISYNAGISLTHRLSRRVSVSTSGAYRTTDRLEREFWSRSASAALRVQMTRDVSLRVGYSLAEAHYEGRPTVQQHRPDIGLDFGRALSLTRRTTMSFGVGTEATVANDRTRIRASGNASMTHEIGRSWSARAAYQRGTTFVETIPEPVFSDSAQVSLSGLITRRIQFTSIGSALFGNTGTSSRQFDSYRASAGISVALTRYMNAGVNYAYYKYVFDPLIELPSGIPHDVNRQSIRAQVSFWAPLLNKTRR